MKHYDEKIIEYIQLYLLGVLPEEKVMELEEWIKRDCAHQDFFDDICRNQDIGNGYEKYAKINRNKAWKIIASKSNIKETGKKYRLNLYRWAAAVVLPVLIAIGGYWELSNSLSVKEQVEDLAAIKPGKQRAILRLSNDEVMKLTGDRIQNVKIAEGVNIMNDTTGVVYPEQIAAHETEVHTLEIPRGGEYSITLSDGTVVYLNSGSKLRYPVAFGDGKREVYLSGEGYFKVTKDTERPFWVITDNLSIKVYGTSFNVNTYKEKIVRTVLVEGKIGIRTKDVSAEFRVLPGEMAVYDIRTQTMNIQSVDVYPYIAWKDHIFAFENESLEEIMNTLSLWYDIDVFFQKPSLKDLHFTGHLGRYENISSLLDAISFVTQVRFSIKGRTIIVTE